MLLLRAGLAVADPILTATEALCGVLGVPRERRWRMSPFGGDTTVQAWRTADLAAFLASGQPASTPQAAFRVAFDLPPVARVAVGTSRTDHLAELVAATELAVNDEAIGRYRGLIRAG